jgi:hypothetical protein
MMKMLKSKNYSNFFYIKKIFFMKVVVDRDKRDKYFDPKWKSLYLD